MAISNPFFNTLLMFFFYFLSTLKIEKYNYFLVAVINKIFKKLRTSKMLKKNF